MNCITEIVLLGEKEIRSLFPCISHCGFPMGDGKWGDKAQLWGVSLLPLVEDKFPENGTAGNMLRQPSQLLQDGQRASSWAPVVFPTCTIAPRVNQKDVISLCISGHRILIN